MRYFSGVELKGKKLFLLSLLYMDEISLLSSNKQVDVIYFSVI